MRHSLFCLLLAGVFLVACNGGPTVFRGRVVIAQGNLSLLDPDTATDQGRPCEAIRIVSFATMDAGLLDVTVDWTSASNDLFTVLARDSCTCFDILGQFDCDIRGRITNEKPGRLTLTGPAGAYTLVVINLGPGAESASYQIGLTR